jgi:vacuolar-type H+-ATPase subunit I/STV1
MTNKQIIIDEIKLHGNRKDLTGLKVGKLTCLKPVKTGKYKNSEWLCECECGNFKIAQTYRLLSGRIQSCGDCYHTINHYIPMIKELEKQLKAKEQECEMWKNLTVDNGAVALKYQKQLDQLKSELQTKKVWHKIANEIAKKNSEYANQLKVENEELKKEINNKYSVSNFNVIFMREHIHNLKATLTEIKEITEEYQKEYLVNNGVNLLCNQILQKISECEVEDEN